MTNIITESDAKHFAVALPYIDEENLLFQVRSARLDRQPGDVCFPGGEVEPGESPAEAVIRELTEELLVTEDQIELQEECSQLINDPVIIHCFPCRVRDYQGGFNPEEVAGIFCVPISFFKKTGPEIYEVDWKPVFPDDFPFDKIYGGRNYGWRPRKSRIRFYEYRGQVIWGMTARIIENFVNEKEKSGKSAAIDNQENPSCGEDRPDRTWPQER